MRHIKFLGLLFIFFYHGMVGYAQEPEDKMEEEFNNFYKQAEKEFTIFRDSIDKEFAAFIRKSWAAFKVEIGEEPPIEPKPKQLPILPKEEKPTEEKPIIPDKPKPIAPIKKIPSKKKAPKPPKPLSEDKKATEKPLSTVQLNYYGLSLPIQYDHDFDFAVTKPWKQAIPDAWEKLAEADYYTVLKQFHKIIDRTKLNDWAYIMLIQQFAQQRFPADKNKQIIAIGFLLNKLGFVAKLGFNHSKVYLLMPCQQILYERTYLKLEGKQYYVFDFEKTPRRLSNIQTYSGRYRDNSRILDLKFYQTPIFDKKGIVKKTFYFPLRGKKQTIPVTYHRGLVNFYDDYPFTGFSVTVGGKLSKPALTTLQTAFQPLLKGKDEVTQVNTLLSFVQFAFEYKTDPEQFGREKYFFPEELFHYPFSDCEDRSALFATLVRTLLGKKVVALHFSDHLATAVHFNQADLKGNSLSYKGKKYMICDPTYIGADMGKLIPKYLAESPKVVELD